MMLLLTLLLKSLLVFAAAGILLFALRRASAAARHLVCLLTLGAVLALPFFSLALPGWHLPVLAARQEAEPIPVRWAPALPVREGNELGPETHQAFSSVSAAPSSSSSSLLGRTPAKQGGGFLTQEDGFFTQGAGFSSFAAVALYFVGLLLASARPLLGLWGIRRLGRACTPVDDAPTLTAAADCAQTLGLQAPRLCRADVPVPMTWGWRCPVIVLPLASAAWPDARLRSVLLHEMAHVKRRDWPGHRLADFACAVYWFHPLVWLTARRLRSESELACDDLVLASGIPAPDYARHLLEIASALPRVPSRSHTAIAMAQTSQIESRLHMILDKTRPRRTVARRALIFALIPGTAALITLAVLRPDAKAQATPAVSAATYSAAVPSPVPPVRLNITTDRVESVYDAHGQIRSMFTGFKINGRSLLVGVTNPGKYGNKWWSETGTLLPTPVYDTGADHQVNGSFQVHNPSNVILAFCLPPDLTTAQAITTRFELRPGASYSSDGTWTGKTQSDVGRTEAQMFASTGGMRVVTATFPSTWMDTGSINVGLGLGTWKTSASEQIGDSGTVVGTAHDSDGNQVFLMSPPAETTKGLLLTISTNATDDIRVTAINKQGQEVLPADIGDSSINSLDQITAHFSQPLSQIKEFRVETRPFLWVHIKNVALKPVQ